MTQFKDKSQREGADGVLGRAVHLPGAAWPPTSCVYQADQVPVGDDQRQHLELTRDLAHPVQRPLRRDVHRARAGYIPEAAARDHGPAVAGQEDEQEPAAAPAA